MTIREPHRRAGSWLAAAVLALHATAATAADPSDGRSLYLEYCAVCHGADAKGGGPMAPELRSAPADLTRLDEKYGTPLAKPRLVEVIDGRDMVRSHGSTEMPVWGKQLLQGVPPGAGTEAHKRGTILQIVDWLDTVQGK